MYTIAQITLISLVGIIGSIIGLIISGIAKEELQEHKKMFIYLQHSIIVAMTFILLFTWNVLFAIIGSAIVLIAIILFEKKEIMKMIILYTPILYISIALITEHLFFEVITGLLGLFFIIHMGVIASKNKKTIDKGIWKKETWKLLIRENFSAFSLPAIMLFILLF